MGASGGDMRSRARNRGNCSVAAENLMTTMRSRPLDRRIQMTADPEMISGPYTSWLDRRRPTDHPVYLDRNDLDEWAKWQADRASVDRVLARAGMFQGVEPSAVSALTAELHPV